MNVINNLKKAQLEAPEKKLLYARCVIRRHSAIVTRILNIFGKEPQIRKRNISLCSECHYCHPLQLHVFCVGCDYVRHLSVSDG